MRVLADDGFRPRSIPGLEGSQNLPMFALRLRKTPRKDILKKKPVQPIPVIKNLAHQRSDEPGAGFIADELMKIAIFL